MKGVMQLWTKIKTQRKTVGAVIQCVSHRCAIKTQLQYSYYSTFVTFNL